MRKSSRPSPALVLALIALLLALGGGAYAASRINGRSIAVKSLPGNRLQPRSVAANRLKRGVLGRQFRGPITGADIDEASLGPVPGAGHAQNADHAGSAVSADTALNAVNAVNARNLNGFEAGCRAGTQAFAGACWESSPRDALSAPAAAAECAARGGALPDALGLAAFAERAGVTLDSDAEWSSEISNVSGKDSYGVLAVFPNGELDLFLLDATKKYRCVVPLLR